MTTVAAFWNDGRVTAVPWTAARALNVPVRVTNAGFNEARRRGLSVYDTSLLTFKHSTLERFDFAWQDDDGRIWRRHAYLEAGVSPSKVWDGAEGAFGVARFASSCTAKRRWFVVVGQCSRCGFDMFTTILWPPGSGAMERFCDCRPKEDRVWCRWNPEQMPWLNRHDRGVTLTEVVER